MAIKEFDEARKELAKVVVGQSDVVDKLFVAILARGHVLVEGVPGLAKTLIVRSVATISGASFSRIQFTPDLLPNDVVGFSAFSKDGATKVVKGPVFANFVLADEVNRAPPKVQSALLEAMQERQVTIGKETFSLPRPFFVMATQNPLESLGTYPLPRVQLDRFMFKLLVTYPDPASEQTIMERNISLSRFEDFKLRPVFSPQKLADFQSQSAKVAVPDEVADYIVALADATREPKKYGFAKGRFLECGVSPRASISLKAAAQARAFLQGRGKAAKDDVKVVAPDVLRHRVVLSYEGQAESLSPDAVVADLLRQVR